MLRRYDKNINIVVEKYVSNYDVTKYVLKDSECDLVQQYLYYYLFPKYFIRIVFRVM